MTKYMDEYSTKVKLPIPLKISVGYINTAHSRESLEVLVKKADTKMYEAKQKAKENSV
jgi:GGDEF domain-containing protein